MKESGNKDFISHQHVLSPPIFSAQIEGESQFWETWGIMPMRVEPFQPQRPNTGRQKDLAAHLMPALAKARESYRGWLDGTRFWLNDRFVLLERRVHYQ